MALTDATDRPPLHQALLNDWQRDFPLRAQPFDELARSLTVSPDEVIDAYRHLQHDGAVSRIGGVWSAGAGGAAMLCALAVPPDQLSHVALVVNHTPGVNHNYEREHRFNLWFVITGQDRATVHHHVDEIERRSGLSALRLPMRRAYRIDLGFDLSRHAATPAHEVQPAPRHVVPVAPQDARLAALIEEGLPLAHRPYDVWAQALGMSTGAVLGILQRWLVQHTLRRFGVVVRHHNVGFAANAMTVFDVPDDRVDEMGRRLAGQSGITLCYQRERAPGWPYNLYCMVHGRDRHGATQMIQRAIDAAGLRAWPHEVLFSIRRFKQTGGRYFSSPRSMHLAPLLSSPQEAPAWT